MSQPNPAYRWIAPAQLGHLLEGQSLRVLDVRTEEARSMGAPHVPGAIHVSASDLLREKNCLPLLAFHMAELGVGDEHAIVVYDEDGSGPALDVAQMLVRCGHAATWALAGGFRAWCASGLLAVRRWSTYPPASFTARLAAEETRRAS